MKAVSFSGLQLYKSCPSAFRRRYIYKEKTPETASTSPAASRGTTIHQNIDDFISGEVDELHEACAHLEEFLLKLREERAVPEARWAMDNMWNACDFLATDAYIRGVMDAILVKDNVCYVYEWKTGKRYGDHELQRALYGLAALCRFSQVDECTVITTYIDLGENDMSTYDKAHLRAYQWLWQARVSEVWSDDEYLAKPSWKCQYCEYNVDNGGTCEDGAAD